jgi:hypothetical protein
LEGEVAAKIDVPAPQIWGWQRVHRRGLRFELEQFTANELFAKPDPLSEIRAYL